VDDAIDALMALARLRFDPVLPARYISLPDDQMTSPRHQTRISSSLLHARSNLVGSVADKVPAHPATVSHLADRTLMALAPCAKISVVAALVDEVQYAGYFACEVGCSCSLLPSATRHCSYA
jgi:hypothetical protein